jgi:membrane dipeptidase
LHQLNEQLAGQALPVRVVGMAWARGSRWAGGNGTKGPLTAGGRDLVQAFDALGILHDVSHLSDEAFDGLCAASGAAAWWLLAH